MEVDRIQSEFVALSLVSRKSRRHTGERRRRKLQRAIGQFACILQVANLDYFVHLIGVRFVELQHCELATDLITPNVSAKMPFLEPPALRLRCCTSWRLDVCICKA